MLSLLKSLQEQGVITQGDYYFAQLIADKQKDKGYTEPVQNLAILLAAPFATGAIRKAILVVC